MPMTPRALAVALLACSFPVFAAGTNSESNGFYLVSTNGGGQEVRIDQGRTDWRAWPPIHTADWVTIRLGEKADVILFGANVHSANNENSRFSVDIALRAGVDGNYLKARLEARQVVLRLGDRGYRTSGWLMQGEDYGLGYTLFRRKEAEAAAQWLSVACTLRSQPKYNVSVRFIPAKLAYGANDSIKLNLELKNLGDAEVRFQAGVIEFEAKELGKSVGAQGRFRGDIDGGFIQRITELAPGKSHTLEIDLNNWLVLESPGVYEVRGLCDLEVYPPKTETESRPSNPPRRWLDDLSAAQSLPWDDRRSAECKVVINASSRR